MNEVKDECRPGKKVLARTVPEEAEINEVGLELINISEVQNLTQISTSGIYARSADREDDFPMTVDIGTGKGKGSKKMWLRLEILQFISNRLENRRVGKPDNFAATPPKTEWDSIGQESANE